MKTTSIPEQWRILITGITSIHGWPIFKKFSSMLEKNSSSASALQK